MNQRRKPEESPLHKPSLHESGYRHSTGEAKYIDDLSPKGTLVSMILPSPHARAKILSIDVTQARQLPGVFAVLTAEDVPGCNLVGPIFHDEPVLAEREVFFRGQSVAAVIATDYETCRAALSCIQVAYQPEAPILTIAEAIEADSYHGDAHIIARGKPEEQWKNCEVVIDSSYGNGAQDHFYLETQAALALPEENGCFHVYSSTQHPSEIQKKTSRK